MKRYYNTQEDKYYYEGSIMTRKIGSGLWSGRPTAEQLEEWGYVEITEPVLELQTYIPTYEELVVQKIRERYTVDDELAIQRQRDTKPEEFAEYNSYCELCKVDAREELGIEEGGA